MKKIIYLFSNRYLKAMLFGFMLIVIVTEYISSILIKILICVIACSIALRPIFKDHENKKGESK